MPSRGRQGRSMCLKGQLALIAGLLCASWCSADLLEGKNAYAAAFMDVSCSSDVLLYPNSTADVAAAVIGQTKAAAAEGAAVKIRATRNNFHTTSPFNCPGQTGSMYPGNSSIGIVASSRPIRTVTLLVDNLTQLLSLDAEKHIVRVQAGMLVSQLLDVARNHSMTLPLGSVPAFGDLTIGGCLVTGAHGSGHNTTSSLADILLELTWVDGRGEVHVDKRDSSAARALIGGLGVAGIVTEVLLQLQGPSHTQLETWYKRKDKNIVTDVKQMLQKSPHVLVVWRPDLQQYTAYVTREVSPSVRTTGGIVNLDMPPFVAQMLGTSLQFWQEDVHDKMAIVVVPVLAAIQEISVGHAMANEIGTNRKMYSGVGDTNEMQAASCGHKCLWNLGANIAMDDVHFSIELERLQEWVDDVKSLISADLWEGGLRRHRLLSPGYFWLRFGRGSQDLISHTSGMVAPVHVQMSFMKSMATPEVPNKFGWILEALEQITLCKYKGKPHWGKNKPRDFTHAACSVKNNLPLWRDLMTFQQTSDPGKVFEPPLFTSMAAGAEAQHSPGCAMRGECFCENASHCAPGYQCLQSVAFPEYSICRLPRATSLLP